MLYITKLVFEIVNAKFFRSIHGNALILVILVLRVGYECGLQKKKKLDMSDYHEFNEKSMIMIKFLNS